MFRAQWGGPQAQQGGQQATPNPLGGLLAILPILALLLFMFMASPGESVRASHAPHLHHLRPQGSLGCGTGN